MSIFVKKILELRFRKKDSEYDKTYAIILDKKLTQYWLEILRTQCEVIISDCENIRKMNIRVNDLESILSFKNELFEIYSDDVTSLKIVYREIDTMLSLSKMHSI